MKTATKTLLAALALAVALALPLMAERADVYVEHGTGYVLVYSQGQYIVGFGSAAPTIRGAFGTSGHVVPDNALFFRTDEGTWYTSSAGSLSASSFAGQTLTGATLTTATLTAPTISDPVLSGSATGTYTLAGTPTITAPVLSGTATGTYTLAGTPTFTSPTISGPTFSGSVIGTYTLAGTPTITAPAITGPTITSITVDPTTLVDVGVEAVTNMTVTENGDGAVHKTTFTFSAHSVTMTDATDSTGSVAIYTFPEGFIKVYGSLCNLTTTAGVGGITDTAALVLSVGSVVVATDNATLTSTEADIIASYAGTLIGGEGVFTKDGALVAAAFDGHTTDEAIFLNLAVPDADTSANDTIELTGDCTIVWSNLGDF